MRLPLSIIVRVRANDFLVPAGSLGKIARSSDNYRYRPLPTLIRCLVDKNSVVLKGSSDARVQDTDRTDFWLQNHVAKRDSVCARTVKQMTSGGERVRVRRGFHLRTTLRKRGISVLERTDGCDAARDRENRD